MATILLVEDDPTIQHEVKSWLGFDGYDVLTADNGRAGLETAISVVPDLIISDIRMPELDGRELLAEIRSNPKLKHIPVILATASAESASIQQGFELGANAYITKPFDFDEIFDAVRNWIGKSS